MTTYGIIKSKEYYTFESNDELVATKTFKHNAYIDSGSAVLNKNMNIIGINIGV